jgi:hypothetical protein
VAARAVHIVVVARVAVAAVEAAGKHRVENFPRSQRLTIRMVAVATVHYKKDMYYET